MRDFIYKEENMSLHVLLEIKFVEEIRCGYKFKNLCVFFSDF